MNDETARKLREPFRAEDIGKLPLITCGQCRRAQTKSCPAHPKTKCSGCGNWMTPQHIHLDYVGHAELTDRLLQVDPEWNWEPVAVDAHGVPLFDTHGGMWIRLTIAGVTRLGYGHPDGKTGGDAIKETIGDALRNAAMRFGVALDLWRKEPAHVEDTDMPDAPRHARTQKPATAQGASMSDASQSRAELATYCRERGLDLEHIAERFRATVGKAIVDAHADDVCRFLGHLKKQHTEQDQDAGAEAGAP